MAVQKYERAKTGDTVYRPIYFGPDGKRRDDTKKWIVAKDGAKRDHTRARDAAKHYANQQRVAVENGTWIDPTADKPKALRLTFKALTKRFLKNHTTRSGDLTYWNQRVKVWLAFFKDKPATLTIADADRFKRERGATVKSETLRKDLSGLSSMYEWAVARDLVAKNPFHPKIIKRPAKSKTNPCPLTEDEATALLDYCAEHYPALAPVVRFALETGADRGEVLALNWNHHIDRERQVVNLPRAKTGVERCLPYSPGIKRVLARAGKVRHTSGAVFLRDGQPIPLEWAKTAMRRAWGKVFPCRCEDVERPHGPDRACPTRAKGKPWKSLRATFATRKADEGVPLPLLCDLMGWTDASMLLHYYRASAQHLKAAMSGEIVHNRVHNVSRVAVNGRGERI